MKKKLKKISAFIPSDLLDEAARLIDSNQTDALIAGLNELIRAHKRESIIDLRGKLRVKFDIARERERSRF